MTITRRGQQGRARYIIIIITIIIIHILYSYIRFLFEYEYYYSYVITITRRGQQGPYQYQKCFFWSGWDKWRNIPVQTIPGAYELTYVYMSPPPTPPSGWYGNWNGMENEVSKAELARILGNFAGDDSGARDTIIHMYMLGGPVDRKLFAVKWIRPVNPINPTIHPWVKYICLFNQLLFASELKKHKYICIYVYIYIYMYRYTYIMVHDITYYSI